MTRRRFDREKARLLRFMRTLEKAQSAEVASMAFRQDIREFIEIIPSTHKCTVSICSRSSKDRHWRDKHLIIAATSPFSL